MRIQFNTLAASPSEIPEAALILFVMAGAACIFAALGFGIAAAVTSYLLPQLGGAS